MPEPSVDVDLVIEDDRWIAALPDCEAQSENAVIAAFAEAGFVDAVGLCVLLADDARIRTLNRDYRDKDAPTNVLSFPVDDGTPPGAERSVGDIVLAFETLEREARDENRPFVNHFLHLIVHGSLHLIGYTHEAAHAAERMEALETAALARLGVPAPYIMDDEQELVRNGSE